MRKILLISLIFSFSANAEIHKEAYPVESGFEFRWWPVLPKIDGWAQDQDSSVRYGINAQVPEGQSFSDAETIIYSKAVYKPRVPELKTLDSFIQNDQSEFVAKIPSIKIIERENISSSDNVQLQSFSFEPRSVGNWEQVSYMQEGEFYLVFTVSSRTELGLNNCLNAYRQFIENYAEVL